MQESAAVVVSPPLPAGPQRALALDALRGLAILAMCLSGRVAGIQGLPSWMRHAQYPRPWHFDASVAGYTWVDLVFPAFLFAMGAAFPLAMASRLDRGESPWRVLAGALGRALALVFFGVYVDNVQPWKMGGDPLRAILGTRLDGDALRSPTTQTWIAALLGFALLFPLYARLPKEWSRRATLAVRAAALLACAGFLEILKFPDGSGWSVRRFDIIIMVLANMAFFGAGIWIFTRRSVAARLLSLPVVYALLEASTVQGSWVRAIAGSSFAIGGAKIDVSWAYQFAWLKYLFVVVPGTLAGDMLLAWMKGPRGEAGTWSRRRLLGLSFGALALVVFVHAGLQARGAWLPATFAVSGAALVAGWMFVRDAANAAERFLRGVYRLGAYCLMLGLAFEPLEGGIHKDPSTMSYYFASVGLASLLLFALTSWIDVLGIRRGFGMLVACGQNPMIAYVGIRNLLSPVVELAVLPGGASLRGAALGVLKAPWPKAAFGFAETLLLGWATAVFTRLKIYWRT